MDRRSVSCTRAGDSGKRVKAAMDLRVWMSVRLSIVTMPMLMVVVCFQWNAVTPLYIWMLNF